MIVTRRAAALAVLLLACGAARSRDVPPAAAQTSANAFALVGQMVQGGLALGTAPRGTVSLALDGAEIPLAPDGRFLIAFDRDAGPSALLVARLERGGAVQQRIAVAPRAWNISRLDRLPKYPVPLPAFERVRPGELAQVNAARAQRSDSQGWREPFLWPTTGRISTLFGSQRIYAGEPGAYHSGIDIVRATGTVVLAPADGVVVLATPRPFTLEGNLLIVDHGMGLNSAFAHLSRIDVKPGERVRRGQPIGAVGRSGRVTGAHLHWGLRWRDAKLDPLLIAGPMR